MIKAEDHSSPRCSEKKKYKKYSSRPNACICSDYKVPTERGSLLIRAQLIFVPFKAFLSEGENIHIIEKWESIDSYR